MASSVMPQPQEVRAELERILASSPFAGSHRSQQFLRFVVENSLDDAHESLKEYTIAIEVFGRDSSYDPVVDATVRVEAGRLRSRLRDYCIDQGHTRWVRSRDNYFLPKEVLRQIFRGKFVDALGQVFQNGQLRFEGGLKVLAQPKTFAAWLRPLFRQDWVVYLKRPFGRPAYVLHYLGRYTHRVAISNHRLVSLTDGQVTFRWRDSAHHNEQKSTM
jgi:Putative transposase